jgi:AraC-like DNA-binding protein
VLHWESLLAGGGVDVTRVACDGRERGWSATEPVTGFGIVLVRTGLFRRLVDGTESVLDATSGYFQRPGSEQRMAHPSGGDLCTSITVGRTQMEALTRGAVLGPSDADRPLHTSPALDLAHRLLLRWPAPEVAWGLVGDALAELLPRAVAAGFPGRPTRRRQLVDDVREALNHDVTLTLPDLGRLFGLSPYHLSRTFRQVTGQTLTRYKASLRSRRALERLSEGDCDLARLAIELGFADQAHLTRTLRAELGSTPARLRALLSAGQP